MNNYRESLLYKELDKTGWKYSISGDNTHTSCDILVRENPFLSYTIEMSEDSHLFKLKRNYAQLNKDGIETIKTTTLNVYQSAPPVVRAINIDTSKIMKSELSR